MTLPDTGPERPGDASETREMAELDRVELMGDAGGPRGSVVIVIAVLVIAAVVLVLVLR